jgi:Holliday junction resolvase
MGAMSRRKGTRGELEIVQFWKGYGFEAWRTPNSGAFSHSRGDVNGVPGLHQEVKFQETVRIKEWIAQANADCASHDVPIVIWRTSHMPWQVNLPLEEFGPLWKLRSE